ncbi:unnamed protein product [Closterium sp. Naga37s-1]|nr:unnamed protein product [Closterium sp. Naga37s-1]
MGGIEAITRRGAAEWRFGPSRERIEDGEGAARWGSKRTSLLNPRLPSLQGFTWGDEGDGAARAHQGASLWLTPPLPFPSAWRAAWIRHAGQHGRSVRASRGVPLVNPPPSIPFSMAGSVETTRRAARTEIYSWDEEGDGAARAHQEASLWLTPPFHSLQHGGQRVYDAPGGTDGGEVLLHRCYGIYSWDEEGDGAARAHQEASLWLTPPFHSLQHGGQRGDDTAGGTDGGEVLLHRCYGEGDGAARAHQEASLWLTPPFHSLQHGGQRGDDTAGGTDGGEVLLHRCSGVARRHGGRHGRSLVDGQQWKWGGRPGDTDGGTMVQDPKTAPDCGIGVVRQGWLTALGRTRPAPEAPLCVSECSDEGWGDAS